MKHILILSKEYPPDVGGAGVVASQIYNGLLTRGWNIRRNRCFNLLPRIFVFIYSAWYVLISFKYDYVIINDMFFKKIYCFFSFFYTPKNTIIYLHGSEPEFLLSSKFLKKRMIRLCKKSVKVVAVSNYMKDKFLSEFSCDKNLYLELEEKIVVIKNGVDTSIFNYQNVSKPGNILNIATCCRIDWGKGFKEMVEVLSTLKKDDIHFKWHIAGDGRHFSEIKHYIAQSDINNNVCFYGAIPHNEVARLFNHCHFMMLLSNFKESLGLVYMEASCCGCFSIGRNLYGVKEAIFNNITGIRIDRHVEAINAFKSLVIDNKVISKKSKSMFSLNVMLDQVESMFK